MIDIVKEIHSFNDKAGFLGGGMDSFLEASFIFEEAMEGYEDVLNNPDDPNAPVITARDWAIGLLNQVKIAKENRNLPMPSEVDEVDKAIDVIVFSIGKLLKMGLSIDQVYECISIVNTKNLEKIGGPKAEDGKQLKPEGWTPPEPLLQKVLDARA